METDKIKRFLGSLVNVDLSNQGIKLVSKIRGFKHNVFNLFIGDKLVEALPHIKDMMPKPEKDNQKQEKDV